MPGKNLLVKKEEAGTTQPVQRAYTVDWPTVKLAICVKLAISFDLGCEAQSCAGLSMQLVLLCKNHFAGACLESRLTLFVSGPPNPSVADPNTQTTSRSYTKKWPTLVHKGSAATAPPPATTTHAAAAATTTNNTTPPPNTPPLLKRPPLTANCTRHVSNVQERTHLAKQ